MAEQIVMAVDPKHIEKEVSGDEALELLWRQLKNNAYKYTETVCQFTREQAELQRAGDREKRKDLELVDIARGRLHDGLQSNFNILARNMGQRGKDASWLDKFNNQRIIMGLWAIRFTYDKIIENLQQEEGTDGKRYQKGGSG